MRGWIGLGLLGYGFLVLIGLTAHESPWAGAASLTIGTLLCWSAARGFARGGRDEPAGVARAHQGIGPDDLAVGSDDHADRSGDKPAPIPSGGGRRNRGVTRPGIVAGLGAVCVVGVLAYNGLVDSGLGLPEWAILVYGTALLLASTRLEQRVGRADVGTLVAWSLPLVLAPLAMFAANAAFTDAATATAAAPIVHVLVVQPTAVAMGWFGSPVVLQGNNMVLTTPRGGLVLGVGLVCAGLYPMVLFGSLLGLHAWQDGMRRRTFATHLALGVGALWLLNIVRLLLLAHVGIRWGGGTLQTAHAHMGWLLFAAFMVVYWLIARPAPQEGKGGRNRLAAGEEA